MSTAAQPVLVTSVPSKPSKGIFWTSIVLSAIPVALLLFSAVLKLTKSPQVVQGFTQMGFSESVIIPIGITELLCTLIYLVPRTSVFGAVLLAGYLGGATVSNLRGGQSIWIPIACGVLLWMGLWLREPRLQALTPLRK